MKLELFGILLILSLLPATAMSQQWQTVVSVDSRVGYTSNTYLNPFFSEWDESVQSSFGVASLFGQTFWSDNKNSFDATLGLVAEPFLGNDNFWKGGLALFDYRRRLNSNFTGGVEAGGSYFTSNFNRTMVWLQPYGTWFISPFTSLTAKVGINNRTYGNYTQQLSGSQRFDYYGLQFETWAGYNWQFKANLFGSLDHFPSIQEQMSSTLSVSYLFLNGIRITAMGGLERFGFEQVIESDPGLGGGPPFGGGGQPGSTEITQEYDQIVKAGLTGSVPLNKRFTVYASLEGLKRTISNSEDSFEDVQVSAGVRITLQPNIISRSKNKLINPEWSKTQPERMAVSVTFSGGGRLYLVGDFNNWKRTGIPLTQKSKKTYTAELPLDVGAYEYKILHVEGTTEEWLSFSNDTYTVEDGFGGENAMILVD